MQSSESIHIYNENLKTYVFSSTAQKSKATVLLIHGLGEHIRRYDEQINYFAEKGFSFAGADLKGHGRSEGNRGVWNNVEEHYKVIDGVFNTAKEQNPNVPIFLYGHSMGGNLAAGYVLSRYPDISGLLLTGSAIKTSKDLPVPLVKMMLSAPKFIQNIIISNGLNLKSLCNDPDIVDRYKKDPLVHDRISLLAGATLLNNSFDILNTPFTSPYPVLIMHGKKDTITLPKGSTALAAHWNGDITIKLWPGMLHEIHNEPEKKMVWDDMISWMNKALS
ncbi:MAG: lysophospholipase [Saprospiraceae bacterium]